MQGLSLKSLKHHVALQPLMAIMAVGMTFVAVYVGRWFFPTTKWLLWIFALALFHLVSPYHDICDRRSIFVKSFYKIEKLGVPKKDVNVLFSRLASKTTDVNWTKAKDLGDHMGYYKARSRYLTRDRGPIIQS